MDPIRRVVLGLKHEPKELYEMREPFIWIERILDTHIPYGVFTHGNDVRWSRSQWLSYLKSLRKSPNPAKEYVKGVFRAREHIRRHLRELKNMGVMDRTLIIITTDHGENLNPGVGEPHTHTTFKGASRSSCYFLTRPRCLTHNEVQDVLPTALDILGLNWRKKQSVYKKRLRTVKNIVLV